MDSPCIKQTVCKVLKIFQYGNYLVAYVLKRFQCNYPKMSEINIDLKGILKLLSNLKPDKAPGPDGIKPIILKELREEIAPVIHLLFQKSISTG